jgi:hypothetical protein
MINLTHEIVIISPNGSALTTPLNRTYRACLLGGASLPVKGCGCPDHAPKQMHPATQGTHASCSCPPCRSLSSLLDGGPCPSKPCPITFIYFFRYPGPDMCRLCIYCLSWVLISNKLRLGVCTLNKHYDIFSNQDIALNYKLLVCLFSH